MSVSGDSPVQETKLKWDQQENRFTKKPLGVREEPSKDDNATRNYL